MIIAIIFFTIVFFSYSYALKLHKGNIRATFNFYLIAGIPLPVLIISSNYTEWTAWVLAGSVQAFWMASIYAVMELRSKMPELK